MTTPARSTTSSTPSSTPSSAARSWTPIHLPDLPPPVGAYSPAVRAGDLIFVSGQVPRDPATGTLLGDTIEEQTRSTLANVARALKSAGASLDDVVSATVYLASEDDWTAFNDVYKSVMTPPYPSRAAVGVSLRGILVEISVVAYRP